jgi:hypothetical protein
MDELIELIRKFESLFLPFLPRKWQNPPPSYRIIVPLLEKIGRYENRFPWVEPLLYTIRTRIYPPYHEGTLTTQGMTAEEMRWIRFILAVVVLVLVTAFLNQAPLLSLWIKGGLLLASSVLFIHGAMQFSISALWVSWGFLFPLVIVLGIGSAPWAMVFLASWCLLWHVPAVKEGGQWRWYDVLSTFPILFFWIGRVSKMLPPWPFWQSAVLFLLLWFSLWTVLLRRASNAWISRTCQLFWPASLTILTLIGSIHPKVHGLPRFGLWFFGTLGLSLGMSRLTPQLSGRSYLYRWMTIGGVFAIFALYIFVQGPPAQLQVTIDTSLLQLFNSLELLWWVIGAGIILSVRGMTMVFLKWIQALLHRWILPLSAWVIPVFAFAMGWLGPWIDEVGKAKAAGLWVLFALGTTILAWRRKEGLLREWVFWGLFLLFLSQQYRSDAEQVIDLYWKKAAPAGTGFVTLAIWLLCLSYYSVSRYMGRLREKARGGGTVAVVGAMLWLMVAILWMGFVDGQLSYSIRGLIHYHVFQGFTFLGIPLIIYHLIMGRYLRKDLSRSLAWSWILIAGLGFTQILQGVEHFVVARFEGQTLDQLQKMLLDALLSGTPLGDVVPAWIINFYWILAWRTFRWVLVMLALSWAIRHRHRGEWEMATSVLTFCFASLAVWTAEAIFLFWPSLPLEWAVILRPWLETTLMWEWSPFKLYLLYLLAGLLWGWLFFRTFPAPSKWKRASS